MPMLIIEDVDLSPNSKILASILLNLCAQEGFCWASNTYLADKLSLTVRQIQRCLVQLKKYFIIDLEESVEKGGRRIILRGDIKDIIHDNKDTTPTSEMSHIINKPNKISKKLEFSKEDLNDYSLKFPRIDIEQERQKATLWLEETGNTKVNYRAFFTRWLMNVKPQTRQTDQKAPTQPVPPASLTPEQQRSLEEEHFYVERL